MKTHDHFEDSPSTAPLHEVLWSLGKSWLHGSSAKGETVRDAHTPRLAYSDPTALAKARQLAVQHLAIALRMQGIDEEHDSMLSTLEGLALAGEIDFNDYVVRVSNLFPRSVELLDVTLRMKIASLRY